MNRATLIATLLLALSVPAYADVGGEELRPVVAPAGLTSADYDAVIRDAVSFIEAHPESTFVPAAILRIEGARSLALDDSAAIDRLLAIYRTGISNERNHEVLRSFLRARLREEGRLEEAEALSAWSHGYIRDWEVVGPFGAGTASELDRKFEPESVLDRMKTYADDEEERKFVSVPPGDDEWIRPNAVLPRTNGAVYALCTITGKGEATLGLRARCRGSFRMWLNGEEVLRVDRLRNRLGADFTVGARLLEGDNTLLLKLTPGGSPFSVQVLGSGDDSAMPRDDDPWRMAARAMVLDREGLDLEAVDLLEEVAKALPDEPGIRFLFGETLESAQGLPEVHRKNRAKTEYRAVLDFEPDHLPAAVRLAALKHADDKSEEALVDLRALQKGHPECLLVLHQIGTIMRNRGWEKEALAAAEECLSLSPRFRPARFYLVNYYERKGNVPEAREHLEKALLANHDDFEAIRSLAAQDAERGEMESAAARYRRIAELWPSWWTAQLWVADYLANEDRTGEALEILRELAARFPMDSQFPRRIGNLLRRDGEVAGAIEQFEKALELAPGQSDLRRYVTRLQGEEEDFSLPYEIDALELVKDAPGREEYPRAPAIALLDSMVTRVWPDGSASHVIHMTYKILDEKGVDKFGTVNTNGETLEIRTIAPDGSISEPIGVRQNSFNMPALAAGAVIDYRFRYDTRADPRNFDTEEYFFADPGFDTAVLKSQWVVILPRDLSCHLVTRNFEGEHTKTEEGDTIVHVFKGEKSPRTEREPRMPKNTELLPWARFHRNRPFDDAGLRQLDSRWRDVPVTPLVRAETEKALAGVEGDAAKAEALFHHVNELVTGRGAFGGPTATILEKAGDRFDLLASMMVAAGIPFEFGAACSNRGRDVDWQFAPAEGFRTPCMRVANGDGAPIWIFGGSRFAPFGRIPDGYRGSPVLMISKAGSRIETLPEGLDEEHQVRTAAVIDLSGETPVADLELEMAIDGGYSYRESLFHSDADDRRQRVESWVSGLFTGPKIVSYDFPDLEVLGADARMNARIEIPNFLRNEGGEVTAGIGISPLDVGRTYVGKPERIHPMVLREDYAKADEAEIHLGEAYRVTSLPRDHVTMGPIGAYSLTYRLEDGVIRVRRKMRFRPTTLTPDEYRELLLWVKAVDDAESKRIRLMKD